MALQRWPGFCDGFGQYQDSPFQDSEQTWNLYPEPTTSENSRSPISLKSTPGIQSATRLTIPEFGPIVAQATTTPILSSVGALMPMTLAVVATNTTIGSGGQHAYMLYYYNNGGGNPVMVGLLPQAGFITRFKFVFGNSQALIIAQDQPSTYAGVFNFNTSRLSWLGADANGPNYFTRPLTIPYIQALGWLPATDGDFIDGWFVMVQAYSQTFFKSGYQDCTQWNALDYSVENDLPDSLVAIRELERELWLFGRTRTIPWSDTGAAAFPFTRINSVTIPYGAMSARSVVKMGKALFWAGQEKNGSVQCYRLQGGQAVSITPPWLSSIWQSYPGPITPILDVYEQEAHSFLIFYVPEGNATWVWDDSTQKWHARGVWNGSNAFAPDGLICYTRNDYLGGTIAADMTAPKAYVVSRAYPTRDGATIVRKRRSLHLNQGAMWNFYSRFFLDTNLTANISLSWSDDYGATWTAPINPSRTDRQEWLRLGAAPKDRIYEVWITESSNQVTISDAWLELEGEAA